MGDVIEILTTSTNSVEVIAQGPQGPKGDKGDPGDVAGLPLSTQGDLLYRGASENQRLPIGSAGQVLKVSAQGLPSWAAESGAVTSVNGQTGAVTVAAAQHAAEHEPGYTDAIQATAALVTTNSAGLNGIYFSDDTSTNGKLNFFRTGTRKNTKLQYNSSTLRWELIRNLTVEAESIEDDHPTPWGQSWSDPRTPAQVTSITVARVALETMVQKLAETGGAATATTSEDGLMSSSDKTKLNGIASGAEVNVQANWTESNSASDAFIQNKPSTFAPSAHSSSHAAGGSDPLFDQNLNTTDPAQFASVTTPDIFGLGALEALGTGSNFTRVLGDGGLEFGGTNAASTRTNLGLAIGTDVAAASHVHGNITSDGKLGSTPGLPVVTTTAGAVTTLALGTANQVLRVNSGATGVEFADPAAAGVTSVTGTAPIVSSGGTTPAISVTVGTTANTVAAGDDSRITGAAQKSANLSDLASASTARTNLGVAIGTDVAAASHTHTASAISDSTTAGRALLTAADAAAQRTALSLAASATTDTTNASNISSGTLGTARLSVGTTTGTVAAGDDSRFHTRSHAITSTSDHTASSWSVFYSNGSGQVTELALGAANTVLTSNGASSAPSFAAAASGGTKTYAVFTAEHNQPPSSSFATLDTRNSIAVLDFDDATTESAVFVGIMPEAASLGSGLIVRIHFMATTATSGNVRWSVSFERGNTDLDADSFDAATAATTATSSTSGVPAVSAITCTAIDGIAAGDPYRLRIQRLGADAADSMSGDAEILAIEVRSAA